MTNQAPGDEPVFFVDTYATITRDPRTRLAVAIGGDDRAASILQRIGGFIRHPGPRGPYHRQPHVLSAKEQRRGATGAAPTLALLQAGYSVHLDPDLNTLDTPDEGRQAAHRYPDQLTERARNADDGPELAAVLTEIVAPGDSVLPRLGDILAGCLDELGRAPPQRRAHCRPGRPADRHGQQPVPPHPATRRHPRPGSPPAIRSIRPRYGHAHPCRGSPAPLTAPTFRHESVRPRWVTVPTTKALTSRSTSERSPTRSTLTPPPVRPRNSWPCSTSSASNARP